MQLLEKGSYFVTGTDTDCGKTFVTAKLLQEMAGLNKTSLGLKPVAAGGTEDVQRLQEASTLKLPVSQINPYYLSQPLSPHLAAKIDNVSLSVSEIVKAVKPQLNKTDYCFVEGAGGILVPLNTQETLLDLMKVLNLPVILVVGMRLGCLNHALLSWEMLKQAKLTVAGWVASQVDPTMQCYEENVDTLREKLGEPLREYQNTPSMHHAQASL